MTLSKRQKIGVWFVLLAAILVVGAFVWIKFPSLFNFGNKEVATGITKKNAAILADAIDKRNLNGNIVYVIKNKLNEYNLNTSEDKTLYEASTEFLNCYFSENNCFAVIGTELHKINIQTGSDVALPLGIDVSGGLINGIFPSPDENKAILNVDIDPYRNIYGIFIVDFQSEKSGAIKHFTNDEIYSIRNGIYWLSDSNHVFFNDNNLTIYEVDTNQYRSLAKEPGLGNNAVGVSGSSCVMWFVDSKITSSKSSFYETNRPNLVVSDINKTFPVKDNDDRCYEYTIPFYRFPVVARDFTKVSKVIPGFQSGEFILNTESNKGNVNLPIKGEIFLVAGETTFKKLNPNNEYSYELIDYNRETRQVLALKKKIVPIGYMYDKEGVPDTFVVVLDEWNYSETIGGIDAANYKEIAIVQLPKESTKYMELQLRFSPDGKYVIEQFYPEYVPGNFDKKLKIFSISDKKVLELPFTFTDKFVWVK
jgi:hypothetical protein